jgi:hypothetical protein
VRTIEVTDPTGDVEDLMDAVGRALEADGSDTGEQSRLRPGALPGTGDLLSRAAMLRQQWRIDSGAIIRSNRPRLGPWLIRMQEFVRRATWWFVEPVVLQIRQYQRGSARVVDGLARQQAATLERMSELESRLAALEERLQVSASERDEA